MFFMIHNFFNASASTANGPLCLRRLISLCCLATIIFSIGCNKDSAQWKVAAAANEKKDGNPEEAIELLQTALRMDPESNSIKICLANLLAENDQGDLGITLCDEVLESKPESKEAWHARASCLLFLGRFEEALADYQNSCADKIDKSINELNELAYYRVLAGLELDKALRQVNHGISQFQQKQSWGRFLNVPIEIRSIVSAALISRYTDNGHLLVMDLLNESIFEEQRVWLAVNKQLQNLLDKLELENEDDSSRDVDAEQASQRRDQKQQAAQNLELVSGNLRVLLAARSLILEDQGRTELADLDRLWLKRIGAEPQNIYDALPGDNECLAALAAGEAMLDTRGYILTQMPWQPTWTTPSGTAVGVNDKTTLVRTRFPYLAIPQALSQSRATFGSYDKALRDLDLAVAVSEVQLLAFNSDLVNRIDFPVKFQDVNALKAMEKRMVAVLRNHRRQAHLKAKQAEAAEQDLLRIEELGFEAGPSLF